MSSTFLQTTGDMGRKILTATALGFIGLTVGVGCALLPPAIPFAVIGLAATLLLWVMPELAAVPDRWARRMIPAIVFVYTCVPVYFAIILPGLPWIQVRRVIQVAWLLPLAIVIAGSTQSRHRIATVLRASPWLTTLTLGFMAITVITLPTAVYPAFSINYVFNCYINWFIPMIGIILLVSGQRATAGLFRVALYAMAVNFVVGAIESYLKRPFLIYVLPASMREQIFQANSIASFFLVNGTGLRQGMYRAFSTYTTALSWGEDCAMLLPFGLHFLSHGRTSSERTFGLFATVLCFLSIVLSGSRGAYVAMIAAVVCYTIFWSFRHNLQNKKSLVGKIGLSIYTMASGSVLLAILFVPRVHNIVLGGGEGQLSTNSRYEEWALAKPKILARPIFGWGGGSAGDIIHYPTSWGGFTVDGFHMNLLVDYGVPGCILFFSAFLLAAAICFSSYVKSNAETSHVGNALGASITAFLAYRTTLSQLDSLTMAFILLGLTFVYAYSVHEEKVRAVGKRV